MHLLIIVKTIFHPHQTLSHERDLGFVNDNNWRYNNYTCINMVHCTVYFIWQPLKSLNYLHPGRKNSYDPGLDMNKNYIIIFILVMVHYRYILQHGHKQVCIFLFTAWPQTVYSLSLTQFFKSILSTSTSESQWLLIIWCW